MITEAPLFTEGDAQSAISFMETVEKSSLNVTNGSGFWSGEPQLTTNQQPSVKGQFGLMLGWLL